MATINVERRSTIGLTILTVDSLILFMLFMSKFIFNDPVQWMDPHPTSIIWIWLSLRIIPLLVIKAISTSPSSSTFNISISWAFPGRYLIIAWCIQILDFIVLAIYIFITVYARDDPKTPMYLFPLFVFFLLQFMALLGIATYKGCNKRSAEESANPDQLEPQIGANLDDSGFECLGMMEF